jgi:hypothetical protein
MWAWRALFPPLGAVHRLAHSIWAAPRRWSRAPDANFRAERASAAGRGPAAPVVDGQRAPPSYPVPVARQRRREPRRDQQRRDRSTCGATAGGLPADRAQKLVAGHERQPPTCGAPAHPRGLLGQFWAAPRAWRRADLPGRARGKRSQGGLLERPAQGPALWRLTLQTFCATDRRDVPRGADRGQPPLPTKPCPAPGAPSARRREEGAQTFRGRPGRPSGGAPVRTLACWPLGAAARARPAAPGAPAARATPSCPWRQSPCGDSAWWPDGGPRRTRGASWDTSPREAMRVTGPARLVIDHRRTGAGLWQAFPHRAALGRRTGRAPRLPESGGEVEDAGTVRAGAVGAAAP